VPVETSKTTAAQAHITKPAQPSQGWSCNCCSGEDLSAD